MYLTLLPACPREAFTDGRTSPTCAFETTSRGVQRPRSCTPRKSRRYISSGSSNMGSIARISRCPCSSTPQTTSIAILTILPSMRTYSYRASTHKMGQLIWEKERLRKAFTCSFSPFVISLTWLRDRFSIPSLLASFPSYEWIRPAQRPPAPPEAVLLHCACLSNKERYVAALTHLRYHEIHGSHPGIQSTRLVASTIPAAAFRAFAFLRVNCWLTSASISWLHSHSSILNIGSGCDTHCSSNSVRFLICFLSH